MTPPQNGQVDTARYTLSVVIPFYNEAENVPQLMQEIRTVIERESLSALEVLAVDDGSSDETGIVLERVALDWPLLRVLHHAKNRGQAAALWTAFSAAQGQVIVTLDGDGQNDPGDIPELLKRLRDGVDMVAGYRKHRQDSNLRRTMSRVANAVRGRLLRDGVRDAGCALKVFRREVFQSFLPIRTLYSFMPAFAVAGGFGVVEMPVQHRSRNAGTSKYGLSVMAWRPLVDMLGVCWYARRRIG